MKLPGEIVSIMLSVDMFSIMIHQVFTDVPGSAIIYMYIPERYSAIINQLNMKFNWSVRKCCRTDIHFPGVLGHYKVSTTFLYVSLHDVFIRK